MKKKFWLSLSGILLAGTLSLSFSLAWFFSVYQSRRFNNHARYYLSEHFSFLYNHIQSYLKKKDEPSFSQLQKILSLYVVDVSDSVKGKSGVSGQGSDSPPAQFFLRNVKKKFIFLLSDSGLILAHSRPEYNRKSLPKSSAFLPLIKRHSKGWNQIVKENESEALITIAQPVYIKSLKYFVVAGQPVQKPGTLFISYFKWVLLFGVLSFLFLFLIVFFYLNSFIYAAHFLFRLFGKHSVMERKKFLSYLAHTGNIYLKRSRTALLSVLQAGQKTEKNDKPASEVSFSDIVHKILCQSHSLYPGLRISKELGSDINIPVFSDKLFQSLWELIKNVAQTTPTDQSGEVKIRTFKKNNSWFCCEVEDKGPGMDRATMEKATQLYFTTNKDSTGLGLPFVQSVLSRMGGIMKLQSSESGGLKVCLFIPIDYISYIQNLKTSSQEGVSRIEINY